MRRVVDTQSLTLAAARRGAAHSGVSLDRSRIDVVRLEAMFEDLLPANSDWLPEQLYADVVADRRALFCDLFIGVEGCLGCALEGLEVAVDQAEAHVVAACPLEVVHQCPAEVAGHVDSVFFDGLDQGRG